MIGHVYVGVHVTQNLSNGHLGKNGLYGLPVIVCYSQ